MKYKIQLWTIIVLILIVITLLLSHNANPEFVPFWNLKRAQEKLYLKLRNTPQDKVDYMSGLLNVRLNEMNHLVNSKSYDFVLPTSMRYSALAGQITDLIIANNLKDKIPAITAQFIEHQAILHDIYVIYPKNTDNVEYKYIEDDINYLKLYLDKLAKI